GGGSVGRGARRERLQAGGFLEALIGSYRGVEGLLRLAVGLPREGGLGFSERRLCRLPPVPRVVRRTVSLRALSTVSRLFAGPSNTVPFFTLRGTGCLFETAERSHRRVEV